MARTNIQAGEGGHSVPCKIGKPLSQGACAVNIASERATIMTQTFEVRNQSWHGASAHCRGDHGRLTSCFRSYVVSTAGLNLSTIHSDTHKPFTL